MQFNGLPELGSRLLLLGRVLPRLHSPLAQPTSPASALQRVTPEATVVVRVPVMQFNEFLKRYFRKELDLLALDPASLGRVGDTVLLHRLPQEAQKKEVLFTVKEVVERLGDVRVRRKYSRHKEGKKEEEQVPVMAEHYRSHMDQVAEMYGRNPSAFKYEEAPARGRLEGKRDFTDKVTYYQWHVFKENNNKDNKDGGGDSKGKDSSKLPKDGYALV